MKYTIYQLPIQHDNCFMDLRWAEAHGGVNLMEYHSVYSGEISAAIAEAGVSMMLDHLYMVFNINRPADYQSRSMSVSDVVVLEGIGAYFCDIFGWKKI